MVAVAGQDEAAGDWFRKGIDIEPTLAAGHYQLGMLYQKQQRTDDALRELELATRLAPNDVPARKAYGSMLARQQHPTAP